MNLQLRAACPDDATLLRDWETRPHLTSTLGSDDWQWEIELLRSPDWRLQLIAELDGKAIGFIEIIDPAREDTHYWGDIDNNLRALDIWIGEADCLGKGYGTRMMQQALEICFAEPKVTAVIVDPLASNTRAIEFYKRLGFREHEHRQFGEDACRVMRLRRDDWQPGR